jgi:DNA-binding NarL/FixJ family response regulator
VIRLIIVEDQTLVSQGLKRLLSGEPDFVVVASAARAAQVMPLVRQWRPDVVIMDLRLPDGSGIDLTDELLALPEAPRILVLSSYDEPPLVERAISAGVAGYLPKLASFAELAQAIRDVHAGKKVLHPDIASALMDSVRRRHVAAAAGSLLGDEELTVLTHMAAGLSYGDIAEAMFVSERTVRRRVSAIFDKLGVNDRAQAVAEALRRGLIR